MQRIIPANLLLAAASFACSKSEPARPAEPAQPALPNPPAATQSPRDEVVAFLGEVGPLFNSASEACYAAEQCGVVKIPSRQGELTRIEDAPSCLKMRIPVCAAEADKLQAQPPPAALSGIWPDVVRRQTGLKLDMARLFEELIQAQAGKLPDTSAEFKRNGYWNVQNWVVSTKSPFAARYAAFEDEDAKLRESIIALDNWLNANGACPKGINCTLGKVMNAARR